jgi:hypothetical protein
MCSLPGVRIVHRVKGRPALLRSLRQLRLRVQRFALHRATSTDDRGWAVGVATSLDAALEHASVVVGAVEKTNRRETVVPEQLQHARARQQYADLEKSGHAAAKEPLQ